MEKKTWMEILTSNEHLECLKIGQKESFFFKIISYGKKNIRWFKFPEEKRGLGSSRGLWSNWSNFWSALKKLHKKPSLQLTPPLFSFLIFFFESSFQQKKKRTREVHSSGRSCQSTGQFFEKQYLFDQNQFQFTINYFFSIFLFLIFIYFFFDHFRSFF